MNRIIVFYSTYAPSWDKYKRTLNQLYADYPGTFSLETYDVDSNENNTIGLMALYGVRSVPTSIIITPNKEISRYGAISREELIHMLNL